MSDPHTGEAALFVTSLFPIQAFSVEWFGEMVERYGGITADFLIAGSDALAGLRKNLQIPHRQLWLAREAAS